MKNFILFLSILMLYAVTASGQDKNHVIEINLGVGGEQRGDIGLVFLEGTYGIKATPWLVVGAGLRMNYFGVEELYPHALPVFTHFKFIKRNKKVSPYLAQDLGYGISITEDEGGFYSATTAGINIATRGKITFNFGVDFSVEKITFETQPRGWYQFLAIKGGIAF